jgi:monoamine oxidase
MPVKVIVIGAGMAGMSAASHLVLSSKKEEVEVVVLEANRERIGGRIFTRKLGGIQII